MYRTETYRFQNRYRITARLRTLSPLHVGDGDDALLSDRSCLKGAADEKGRYSTFAMGVRGPVIPGTTLKGVLRSWLRAKGAPEKLVSRVFGERASGGKVEFHDVPLVTKAAGNNVDRWWHETRGTCLAPGVAIDSRTRTAREQLLYYTEIVPEGSEFQVTVTGQDLGEDEIGLVAQAIEAGFSGGSSAAPLGAGTAGGWGRLQCAGLVVETIRPEDVGGWLDSGAASGYESLFRKTATPAAPIELSDQAALLLLDIHLRFEGAMLVNDPSQFRKMGDDGEGVGHAMVRRRDGRHFLPGSSVRGALRAQARRIWQTLAYDEKEVTTSYLKGDEVPEIKRRSELQELPAFYRMFGAPGWRSPVAIPDFELKPGTGAGVRREFVAVDRFTGGAADKKKFMADALDRPEFHGTITVDLEAWKRGSVGQWGLLALLFLLRDLEEGDVTFGLGSSKGFGACRAEIGVRETGDIPKEFGGPGLAVLVRSILGRDETGLADERLAGWERQLADVLA